MTRHHINDKNGKDTGLFWSDKDGDSHPETNQTVYHDPLKGNPVFSTSEKVDGVTYNPSTGKLESK